MPFVITIDGTTYMSSILDVIKDRAIEPITNELKSVTTLALVKKADEKNNTCDIQYVDKNGLVRNRNNVSVRLYGNGTDWFPKRGESVVVQETETTCEVIARYVQNYNMDVRARMKLKMDIYSDSSGADPGGTIY